MYIISIVQSHLISTFIISLVIVILLTIRNVISKGYNCRYFHDFNFHKSQFFIGARNFGFLTIILRYITITELGGIFGKSCCSAYF